MSIYDYDSRVSRPIRMKIPELCRDKQLKHVIFANQFDRELLDQLAGVADRIRIIARDKAGSNFLSTLLNDKRAMLYFSQPSTRTFLSFAAACQILGITYDEVRDPSVSSESKGESSFDSIRMFSSYFDVIIMRSAQPELAERCAYLMNDLEDFNHRNVPIVNGGSGKDQHPTQALLDIYTLKEQFQFRDREDLYRSIAEAKSPDGARKASRRLEEIRADKRFKDLQPGLDNKTFGFCGDIGRGRTVRSLAQLLSLHNNVKLYFVCPPDSVLGLPAQLKAQLLDTPGVTAIRELESFEEEVDGKPAIEQLDALYMTRIQTEWDSEEDRQRMANIDFSKYRLTADLVNQMRPYAPILHPFPRDSRFGEIPVEIDTNPRAVYFRQARNGMWIRAALLAYLFSVDREIRSYYDKHFTQ